MTPPRQPQSLLSSSNTSTATKKTTLTPTLKSGGEWTTKVTTAPTRGQGVVATGPSTTSVKGILKSKLTSTTAVSGRPQPHPTAVHGLLNKENNGNHHHHVMGQSNSPLVDKGGKHGGGKSPVRFRLPTTSSSNGNTTHVHSRDHHHQNMTPPRPHIYQSSTNSNQKQPRGHYTPTKATNVRSPQPGVANRPFR